jgi:hypothetical protein
MQMLMPDVSMPEQKNGRLRLHLRETCPESLTTTVSFNGTALAPTGDVTRFFGNPFDRMISPLPNRIAFELPQNLIRDGVNNVCVTATGAAAEIVYIDSAVPNAVDWDA